MHSLACRPNVENVRVKTGLERDLMEGWEGYRVVSSLIRMPSEHPEVMVWLLVSVLTHESAYGCRPHGAPLNMFTYLLMRKVLAVSLICCRF